MTRVHDPIAAGRRTALRALRVQTVVGAAVVLGFLLEGPLPALGAAVGGGAMAAGHATAIWLALGGIVPARVAFSRLLLSAVAKWVVTVALFALGLAAWQLPPLPMMVGLVVGLVVYLLALNLPETGRNQKG